MNYSSPANMHTSLQDLWPLPQRQDHDATVWHTVARAHGAPAAARMMVVYPRLLPELPVDADIPHESLAMFKAAYHVAMTTLREEIMSPNCAPATLLSQVVAIKAAQCLQQYAKEHLTDEPLGTDLLEDLIEMALSTRAGVFAEGALDLGEYDQLRYDNLAKWGWGSDEGALCDLAVGALSAKHPTLKGWSPVMITLSDSGNGFEDLFLLSADTFDTKDLAMEVAAKEARRIVAREREIRGHWLESKAHIQRQRPLRSCTDKEIDFHASCTRLLHELERDFAFKSVRFIDARCDEPEEVQQRNLQLTIDSVYTACQDLTTCLGLPPQGASLFGNLSLVIGLESHGMYLDDITYDPLNRTITVIAAGLNPHNFVYAFARAFDHLAALSAQAELSDRLSQPHLRRHPRGDVVNLSDIVARIDMDHQWRDLLAQTAGPGPLLAAYRYWLDYLGFIDQSGNPDLLTAPMWLLENIPPEEDRDPIDEYWNRPSQLFAKCFAAFVAAMAESFGITNPTLVDTDDVYIEGEEALDVALHMATIVASLESYWLADAA